MAEDGYEGAWSDVLRFKIVPPPPSPPLDKPAMEKDRINIRWRNLGPEFTYRFQMSRDEDFREVITDKLVQQPEIGMDKPKEPGTYYVRTSAVNQKGHEGAFSDPQSFEIEKGFPYAILGIIVPSVLLILLL